MRAACLLRQAVVFAATMRSARKPSITSVEQILQVVGVAGAGNDLVPVGRLGNKGVDARIGIRVTGNHPEPKFLPRETCRAFASIVLKGQRPPAPGQDQYVRFGSIRLRDNTRKAQRSSLAVAPAAMSAVPSASAARCSSQGICGSKFRRPCCAPSARSISTSKPVRIGHPAPVVAVLIRVPRIPAAAQPIGVMASRRRVGL